MNNVLNIVLVNDHLENFNETWEIVLTALEKKPEDDLVKAHYHRQMAKSTSKCHSAISFRSNSQQRAEELLEVQSCGSRRTENPAAKFPHTSEQSLLLQ